VGVINSLEVHVLIPMTSDWYLLIQYIQHDYPDMHTPFQQSTANQFRLENPIIPTLFKNGIILTRCRSIIDTGYMVQYQSSTGH
jgi:hypothetical protein